MNHSYTGIAGSVISMTPAPPHVANVACCNGSGLQQIRNGILSWGTKHKFASITDGSANTWMIGEQSHHLRDANGVAVTAGVGNPGGLYGCRSVNWPMSASMLTAVVNRPPAD